jgi:2'-5' RNA ligase
VLWLGLGGDLPALADLRGRVEADCVAHGFPPETRPFAPHLTLGRVRENASAANRARLGGQFLAAAAPEVAWTAGAVSLMQSRLTPGGAIYARLATADLAGGGS